MLIMLISTEIVIVPDEPAESSLQEKMNSPNPAMAITFKKEEAEDTQDLCKFHSLSQAQAANCSIINSCRTQSYGAVTPHFNSGGFCKWEQSIFLRMATNQSESAA